MKLIKDLNLAFVDLETTGLNYLKHEIIEIGLLIYDPRQDKVLLEWDNKIRPIRLECANSKSMTINKYYGNEDKYNANIKSSLLKFNSMIENCIIVGQNIDFDITFLLSEMKKYNIKPKFFAARRLDMMSLVWWDIKNTGIKSISLNNLCKKYNVSNLNAHGALADCRRTFEIYLILSKKYGDVGI